ncbi:MFS transporter, ACS family, hexuronate transporter [Granulicella pectinivorans]|uniref:MFS transporter, ACS family, hexuronate transporter n=1 Tax=Granulicella pectinivorans TaxID=474950 RepID=A0A1I6LVG0_9BACT|nr:MFS transporter [Granulicella pectinivorans]SFS07252.1 MFS transporter, ACS family, hexuronate transporter [Granulicella pectinivorans]
MTTRNTADRRMGLEMRWYAVALVTVAIAISYFDRQTLPVAISAIQHNIPISNEQFSYLQTAFLLSYAALYALGGRLLDRLGTRRGFLIIMLWWSIACALHGFASGFMVLLGARFLLGMGEGGAFPAAVRVVAEWIPAHERSTAVGIINAGTALGSVLAPPLIGIVLIHSGWRMVFFAAGGLGLVWVAWWMMSYRSNPMTLSENTLDARLLAWELSFREIIGMRRVQALVFAKFMSDSAWYFLLFWLPKYLYDARGFDIKHVSYYAWIPYAASGVGSFLGGWFSSRLLRQGHTLDVARKVALGLSAIFMPVVMFVPLVPVEFAILLFSVAFFFQQSWSGLIMTVPADVFPLSAVGTVSGLVGFGGAIGGAIFGVVAGYLLGHGFGYGTLFVLVGTFHLIGFLAILLFAGKIQPLTPQTLKRSNA